MNLKVYFGKPIGINHPLGRDGALLNIDRKLIEKSGLSHFQKYLSHPFDEMLLNTYIHDVLKMFRERLLNKQEFEIDSSIESTQNKIESIYGRKFASLAVKIISRDNYLDVLQKYEHEFNSKVSLDRRKQLITQKPSAYFSTSTNEILMPDEYAKNYGWEKDLFETVLFEQMCTAMFRDFRKESGENNFRYFELCPVGTDNVICGTKEGVNAMVAEDNLQELPLLYSRYLFWINHRAREAYFSLALLKKEDMSIDDSSLADGVFLREDLGDERTIYTPIYYFYTTHPSYEERVKRFDELFPDMYSRFVDDNLGIMY